MVTLAYGRGADGSRTLMPMKSEGLDMRPMTLPLFTAIALAGGMAAAQTATSEPQAQQSPTRGAQVQSPSPVQAPQPQRSDRAQARRGGQARHQSQAGDPSQAQSDKQPAHSAATETRPDAKYAHPSGQDSQSDNSSHKTRVATADSTRGTGTANNRGPKESDQNRQVRKLSERKAYTGSSGSKADTSTACSTARPAADGGVNCGTSGNSATEGQTVTKPR